MSSHDDTDGTGRPPDPQPCVPRPPWGSNGAADQPPSTSYPPVVNQPAEPADVDRVAGLVLDRIQAQLGLHQDPQMDIPPVEQAVALRDQAPELYELWLRIARERAATANYIERAPYEVPERLAQSGRPRALGALIIVLAFCGYLAWLGGPGPYIAGLVALVNLGAMVGIFFGLRPGRRPASGRGGGSGPSRGRAGLEAPAIGRWIAGAGHPRPAGKAAEERVAELPATTATPPAGMRGPATPAVLLPGSLNRARGGSGPSAPRRINRARRHGPATAY